MVKTQRCIINIVESDKNKLREQISALEANVAKLETEKKHPEDPGEKEDN